MNSASIVYVEDEEDYQMLVQRILGKAGLNIQIAGSGEEGKLVLARARPDLLILDVNLPDTDGYTICADVRKDPALAGVPILMLTVRRRPEEWLKGFSAGADDYVPKPLDPPELVGRVRACLESRRGFVEGSPEYLLIQAAIGGNKAAFAVLVMQYKQRLIDSLRASGKSAADADDLCAIAFARAYERLRQFKGQSTFYTWLYRIAFNESLHQIRRVNLSLDHLTRNDDSPGPVRQPPSDRSDEEASQQALHAQMQRIISTIPKPYRQMLRWHCVGGLSCRRMARRLKIPPGTAMSRLFKAKQLLRQSWIRHSR